MSTPVNQLPQQVNPNMVPKLEEDQEVLDVIKGMENEFQSSGPSHPSSVKPVHAPIVQAAPAPSVMTNGQGQAVVTQIYPANPVKFGVDLKLAQRAALLAACALFVFYVDDLGSLYSRSPFLEKLQPYDKFIRAIVLVVLYYLAMWKLGI